MHPHGCIRRNSFWASALYNFLEDSGDDRDFEELGQSGEYRALPGSEVVGILGALLGSTSSDYIDVSSEPSVCVLVHNAEDLRSLVGEDAHGFYAIFEDRREAAFYDDGPVKPSSS